MVLKYLFRIILVTILVTDTITSKNAVSATEEDILCLKSIKNSLEDPHNHLSSWKVDSPNINSPGFICKFIGVTCWNNMENRVINMNISSLGLKGKFPTGISNCKGLMSLDLSNNHFYGSIPSNISTMVPFLVTLSLSSNRFNGEIPASLGNCSYLNVLELDHNRLSGRIPATIGKLQRIMKFNVADNLLVGPIPHFVNTRMKANATSYANNPGLCGYPLKPCKTY